MTPVFGICFDLFGRRMWLVSATASKMPVAVKNTTLTCTCHRSTLDPRFLLVGLYECAPDDTVSMPPDPFSQAISDSPIRGQGCTWIAGSFK